MTNYRRKRKPLQRVAQSQYEYNERIRDRELRVINQHNENIGVVPTSKAMELAYEASLDLVVINPKAVPKIAKILDLSKLKYQQSKFESHKQKEKKTKTIRVSVRIGPHDLEVQAKKCDEFLEKGHQTKLQVQMKGREKMHPEVADEVMKSFLKSISFVHVLLDPPKRMGDSYYATLQPAKAIKKTPEEEEIDRQNEELANLEMLAEQ
jgi:translation initiation factor IF-3